MRDSSNTTLDIGLNYRFDSYSFHFEGLIRVPFLARPEFPNLLISEVCFRNTSQSPGPHVLTLTSVKSVIEHQPLR